MTDHPGEHPGTDNPGAGAPMCYRHPGRETYIRCARCERPICPDCMVTAAVGFQCPDCVAAGQRAVREVRTVSGAAVADDPVLVTKVLIGLNMLAFVVQQASGGELTARGQQLGYAIAVEGEWWRLITSAFLHVGLWHIAFNMFALWIVGGAIEPRLGRWRYLTVYLLSALGGSVLSYAVDSPLIPSVGASGAVFGLFGSLFVLAVRLRFDVRGLVAIIALNVVIGFVIPNINWRAHLGGLVVGALLTAVMVYAPQRLRTTASITASAVVLVVLLGVSVARTDFIEGCFEGRIAVEQCESLVPGR